MATFSVNQVRHTYVAKTLKASGNNLEATDTAGTILPKADTAKTTMYFQYMSPGGIESTDKITLKNLEYVKATKSGDLAKKLDRYNLALDTTVNGGAPVAGQDYLLRLAFRQYVGLSPEDQYWKYATVHAYTGMTASQFYKAMAISLIKNLSREVNPLAKVYLKYDNSGADAFTEVTASTDPDTLTGTYTGIQLEQTAQDWILGVMPQGYIPFSVQPTNITVDGDERIWGVVTTVTPVNTVGNGHNIADLEYFSLGARGDIYRNMGFPNVLHTTYLADPTAVYDVLDFHYFYTGSNESVQKSERTMTLVAVDDGSHTAMNALITKINAVSGLTIPALS
jgi:hypothetical protein|nr:MAG TPA: Structural protein [Crassvirales sp.]